MGRERLGEPAVECARLRGQPRRILADRHFGCRIALGGQFAEGLDRLPIARSPLLANVLTLADEGCQRGIGSRRPQARRLQGRARCGGLLTLERHERFGDQRRGVLARRRPQLVGGDRADQIGAANARNRPVGCSIAGLRAGNLDETVFVGADDAAGDLVGPRPLFEVERVGGEINEARQRLGVVAAQARFAMGDGVFEPTGRLAVPTERIECRADVVERLPDRRVVRRQRPFQDRQCPLSERQGFVVALVLKQHGREVLQGDGDLRRTRPVGLVAKFQRPLEQHAGFVAPAVVADDGREVAGGLGDVGMVRGQMLQLDREGTAQQRFGFAGPLKGIERQGQIIEAGDDADVVGTNGRLDDLQLAPMQILGFEQSALQTEQRCQVVQRHGVERRCGAGHLGGFGDRLLHQGLGLTIAAKCDIRLRQVILRCPDVGVSRRQLRSHNGQGPLQLRSGKIRSTGFLSELGLRDADPGEFRIVRFRHPFADADGAGQERRRLLETTLRCPEVVEAQQRGHQVSVAGRRLCLMDSLQHLQRPAVIGIGLGEVAGKAMQVAEHGEVLGLDWQLTAAHCFHSGDDALRHGDRFGVLAGREQLGDLPHQA